MVETNRVGNVMLCKDCSAGYKLQCLECGKQVIVCIVDANPEIILNKYWEDEEGCEGI